MLFSLRKSLSIFCKNLYNGHMHPNWLSSLSKILTHALITLPILANKFPFYGLHSGDIRTLRLHSTNETGSGKVLLTIPLLASRHLCKHPSKPTVTFSDSQVLHIASFLLFILLGFSCVQSPCLRLLLSLSHFVSLLLRILHSKLSPWSLPGAALLSFQEQLKQNITRIDCSLTSHFYIHLHLLNFPLWKPQMNVKAITSKVAMSWSGVSFCSISRTKFSASFPVENVFHLSVFKRKERRKLKPASRSNKTRRTSTLYWQNSWEFAHLYNPFAPSQIPLGSYWIDSNPKNKEVLGDQTRLKVRF